MIADNASSLARRLIVSAVFLVPFRVGGGQVYMVAQTIPMDTTTVSAMSRHTHILTSDSMRGRPGLERTARYIATQFQSFGLKPWGDQETWLQGYSTQPQINFGKSRVIFASASRGATADFVTAAYLFEEMAPKSRVDGNVVILTGRHTVDSLQKIKIRNKILVYIPPVGSSYEWLNIAAGLLEANQGLIIIRMDSANFANHLHHSHRLSSVGLARNLWAINIFPPAADGLTELLATEGIDLAKTIYDSKPTIRELSSLRVSVDLQLERPEDDPGIASNVVGFLEGRDSALKGQYVVFTTSMGIPLTRRENADSATVEANDDVSGVAGLIELARTFSRLPIRPRRSLVFLATERFEKGFQGDEAYIQRDQQRIVTAINLTQLGYDVSDSLTIAGDGEIELPTPIQWIITAHPELRLTVLEKGTVFTPTFQHFAFVRNGIPSFSILDPAHDTTRRIDVRRAVDMKQAVRIVHFIAYLGQSIVNMSQRPRWVGDGLRKILGD